MAVRTLAEIAEVPLLALTKPKELARGMKAYGLAAPTSFKLSAAVAFAPSVFGGTGEEERQSIVLSIASEDYGKLDDWFGAQRTTISVLHPAAQWHSPLKPADKFPATLKAKINVKGPKACQCFDLAGQSAPFPARWQGLQVTAVIRLGGAYAQAMGAGPFVELTHLQYDPTEGASNPFA